MNSKDELKRLCLPILKPHAEAIQANNVTHCQSIVKADY